MKFPAEKEGDDGANGAKKDACEFSVANFRWITELNTYVSCRGVKGRASSRSELAYVITLGQGLETEVPPCIVFALIPRLAQYRLAHLLAIPALCARSVAVLASQLISDTPAKDMVLKMSAVR